MKKNQTMVQTTEWRTVTGISAVPFDLWPTPLNFESPEMGKPVPAINEGFPEILVGIPLAQSDIPVPLWLVRKSISAFFSIPSFWGCGDSKMVGGGGSMGLTGELCSWVNSGKQANIECCFFKVLCLGSFGLSPWAPPLRSPRPTLPSQMVPAKCRCSLEPKGEGARLKSSKLAPMSCLGEADRRSQ